MNDKREKIKKINEKISTLNNFLEKYGEQISPKVPKIDENAEMVDFMNIAEKTREALRESGRELSGLYFKKVEEIKKTQNMLEFVIENKKWKDPYLEVNLLLEWALYRAFWALGGRIIPGFGPVLNWDGSEPIHTSSGLQPDLLVDFDDFYLVVESTISSGPRQYDTEAEPVIRHIARIIQENKQKRYSEPVYAFFIAREIDPNVIEYFFVYHAFHKHPLAEEFITVIPLTVDQFKNINKKLVNEKSPKETLINVFEQVQDIKRTQICASCGVPRIDASNWYKQVLNIIQEQLNSH